MDFTSCRLASHPPGSGVIRDAYIYILTLAVCIFSCVISNKTLAEMNDSRIMKVRAQYNGWGMEPAVRCATVPLIGNGHAQRS